MRYRHRPSKLVGDVNISMNIQYAAIISEMPDVPHIGPWPWNRPPQNIAGHAWPSACGANGTKRGRNSERRCFVGNHRIPIRCVGTLFRNNRAIPKPTFRLTKYTSVGEVGANRRWGGTGKRNVYFANISAYSESWFNSALSCTDRTSDRFRLHRNSNVFFKSSHIEVRGAAYN